MFYKQGAQYRVYMLWGNRVKKVPHSLRRAEAVFRKWAKDGSMGEEEIKRHARLSVENGRRAATELQQLAARYPEVHRYLCSPVFSRRGSYSQRRVRLLDEVFKGGDHAANVRLIEAYAESLKLEWQYGFCETEFNLVMNNGLDADGQIVLLDFGDVVFEKARLLEAIKDKLWLTAWSYTHGLPEDLRQPFADIMARKLTPANVERHWGKLRQNEQL